MTVPQTVRYVAKCRTCKRAGAVDAVAYAARIHGRDHEHHGIPIIDEDFPTEASWGGPVAAERYKDWTWVQMPQPPAWTRFRLDMDGVVYRVLVRVGLWCPDHEQMRVTPLKATRNESKRCDSRCQSATSRTCDCSCGGEQHGSAWIIQQIGA